MSQLQLFAKSKNGIDVYYDPENSHASTHFADTPQIIPFVKKILEQTTVSGDIMEFDTDTGVELGQSGLVETDATDEIVYAIRKNRDRHIRFTKSRTAGLSSMVTINLNRLEDGRYNVYSAWLGSNSPPTPNSPMANEQSRPFWANHALVWGTQEVLPGTETTVCPW